MIPDAWLDALDGIAKRHGWPTTAQPQALAEIVSAQSAAYNNADPDALKRPDPKWLAARLLFSFPRDVPKCTEAVRELAAQLQRPLTVLDLGAGLGATTWGLALALDQPIHATLIDADAAALKLAEEIGEALGQRQVTLKTRVGSLPGGVPSGRYDVILLGQVFSELDRAASDRVVRHADLLHRLIRYNLNPDGALVVIEPALRDRTRHWMTVRDALVAQGHPIFAPCPHAGACPMLAFPQDWCHEDRAVDLPKRLWPVAKAAGLRWERLTFAYGIFCADGRRLGDSLRVVGTPPRSKGKRELSICGEFSGDPAIRRLFRLDREANDENDAWGMLTRGDRFDLVPALTTSGGRLSADSQVLKRD